MKRIFAVILCLMLVFATPLVAYAEEADSEPVPETTTESESTNAEETLPDKIVGFITENYTESSLVSLTVTVVVYLFYEIKKHRSLNGSIGVLNNNAVTVAENSAKAINDVIKKADNIVNEAIARSETIAADSSTNRVPYIPALSPIGNLKRVAPLVSGDCF